MLLHTERSTTGTEDYRMLLTLFIAAHDAFVREDRDKVAECRQQFIDARHRMRLTQGR